MHAEMQYTEIKCRLVGCEIIGTLATPEAGIRRLLGNAMDYPLRAAKRQAGKCGLDVGSIFAAEPGEVVPFADRRDHRDAS